MRLRLPFVASIQSYRPYNHPSIHTRIAINYTVREMWRLKFWNNVTGDLSLALARKINKAWNNRLRFGYKQPSHQPRLEVLIRLWNMLSKAHRSILDARLTSTDAIDLFTCESIVLSPASFRICTPFLPFKAQGLLEKWPQVNAACASLKLISAGCMESENGIGPRAFHLSRGASSKLLTGKTSRGWAPVSLTIKSEPQLSYLLSMLEEEGRPNYYKATKYAHTT